MWSHKIIVDTINFLSLILYEWVQNKTENVTKSVYLQLTTPFSNDCSRISTEDGV